MPDFKILLASEYFERRLSSLDGERTLQSARVDIVYAQQQGALAQKREDLAAMLPKVQIGHWVCFHVLIPEGPYNATEGTETISGVVLAVQLGAGGKSVVVKVECNPANTKLHGIDHGHEVLVNVNALCDITKAIPRGQTGPSGGPIRDFIQPGGGIS